jgi:hypothetical protein
MSNYPDGVTDAHPHFNPAEGSLHLTCGNDEAQVVPVHAIREELKHIWHMAGGAYKGDGGLNRPASMGAIVERIEKLQESLTDWERDSDYECPFEGVVDVDISEEADWRCPVCGGDRVSDTTPEDRDPDYEHDRDR